MLQEYKTHLVNKKAVDQLKRRDKKSAGPSNCVACFDLQKVLNCPRSETCEFYYKNKLSVFNFTLFELANLTGHCFVWNETDAKKGANEVGSCLFQFIQSKV